MTKLYVCICFAFLTFALASPQQVSGQAANQDSPKRNFEFQYGASLTGIADGAKVKVWVPIAEENPYQTIRVKDITVPSLGKFTREPIYGNRMLYFEHVQKGDGNIALEIDYLATRTEAGIQAADVSKSELEKYLKPNQKVPVEGKPVEVFEAYRKANEIEQPGKSIEGGKVLYDFVESHMKYDKSKPGYGNGDSIWACESQTGNCTDFHSLFISVARANGIPSRFEIGFPLPAERGEGKIGGYHCWALFFSPEKGWVPVDISEADKDPSKRDYFFGNLNENRIQFSVGRDIILEPAQESEPLNYFVYPHVEVDGKVLPREQIKLDFYYKDLD